MMKKDSVEEMITVLLEKGNLSLAIEIFHFFKPTNEKIVEKLTHALIKVDGFKCENDILQIKASAGMKLEFSAWEAEQIIAPYLDEKNTSHRPYYSSIHSDVVRAASKHTVMKLLELALHDEGPDDARFKENVYYILKEKLS